MIEEETISDFNQSLCDISNESFALGERESKLELLIAKFENL